MEFFPSEDFDFDAEDFNPSSKEIKMYAHELERHIQLQFMPKILIVKGKPVACTVPVENGFKDISDEYLNLYCATDNERAHDHYLHNYLSVFAEFNKVRGSDLEQMKFNQAKHFLTRVGIMKGIK